MPKEHGHCVIFKYHRAVGNAMGKDGANSSYEAIFELEDRSNAILDKLVALLERGDSAKGMGQKLADIESKATKMGFGGGSELELNERTVMLDKMYEELTSLSQNLPEAVIATYHEDIAGELEGVVKALQSAKAELDRAKYEDNGAAQRRLRSSAAKRIADSKESVGAIEELLDKKPRIPDHPIEKSAARAHNAIKRARLHIDAKMRDKSRQRLAGRAGVVKEEMKIFLQRQLEGRIFADSNRIQLRSDLTGQTAEWQMDDSSMYALEQLFGESSLASMLRKIRKGDAHLAAAFACKPAADGIVVEIEAGERTIVGDSIVFTPHKARIMP